MNRSITLAITLALILSLAAIVIWLASRPDAAPQQMPELAGFATERVYSIEIMQRDASLLTLKRSREGWQLQLASGQESRADNDAVVHLLNDLAAMKPVRVVTRNPEQYEKLKVGPGAAKVTLQDQQESTLFEVLIGKQGSDLLSTYIRIAEQPEVLAVDRSLLWQLRRPVEGWRAKVEAAAPAAGKEHE